MLGLGLVIVPALLLGLLGCEDGLGVLGVDFEFSILGEDELGDGELELLDFLDDEELELVDFELVADLLADDAEPLLVVHVGEDVEVVVEGEALDVVAVLASRGSDRRGMRTSRVS